QVVDGDEDRTGDHGGERHQKGHDTGWQRHQSPPRFFAAPRAHDWAGRNVPELAGRRSRLVPDLAIVRL
ncbi:MAG: hypothetical protein ABSE84_33170, partial [Isosphaeraceae bacterium]